MKIVSVDAHEPDGSAAAIDRLFDAKFLAPRPRVGGVPRARLVAAARSSACRFVGVTAPAGYGKSTFLAEWAAAEDRHVAWVSLDISFAIGFTVRLLALYRGWEEPLAKEPTGVYRHSDGRPLLGRKLAGKSEREMRDLGLAIDKQPTGSGS